VAGSVAAAAGPAAPGRPNGAGGGYVAGGYAPRPFPVFEMISPLADKKLLYDAKFPLKAWRPDQLARIALAEFGDTGWRKTIRCPSPPRTIG